MRTTVSIDPELQSRVRDLARERGVSFREALNDVLRRGLAPAGRGDARRYEVPARPLGLRPGVDLDRALGLAAGLEDDEIAHRLELRK